MAAVFPGGVKTYTNKVDGVSVVLAADMNSVQEEVNAIETALGTTPATSVLGTGSIGTYSPVPGPLANVSARIKNLEAGLSAESTDGSRVGYTLLYSGNFTSAPGALAVTGSSYTKIVVVVRVTTQGAGTSITLAANGATTVKNGYFNYAAGVPTTGGGNTTGVGVFNISNGVGPSSGETVTAEIYNVSGTGAKPATWVNGTGFGSGIATAGGTIANAITTITIAASTYPTTATYSVYGVK